MIELVNVYRCKCEKCQSEWTAKDAVIPTSCAKCRSVKWNTQDAPKDDLTNKVKALRTSERLALFEHFELCCGMDRGQCVCEAEKIEVMQTPIDDRKMLLASLQAKIDGIQDGPKVEVIDDSWIEMPTTIENGETLYWHRKVKGSPVCYKRETNWDTFA